MKRQHLDDIRRKIMDLKVPHGQGVVLGKFRKVGNATICSVTIIPTVRHQGSGEYVKRGAKWVIDETEERYKVEHAETLIGVARKRKGDIYNKDVGEILAMLDLKR